MFAKLWLHGHKFPAPARQVWKLTGGGNVPILANEGGKIARGWFLWRGGKFIYTYISGRFLAAPPLSRTQSRSGKRLLGGELGGMNRYLMGDEIIIPPPTQTAPDRWWSANWQLQLLLPVSGLQLIPQSPPTVKASWPQFSLFMVKSEVSCQGAQIGNRSSVTCSSSSSTTIQQKPAEPGRNHHQRTDDDDDDDLDFGPGTGNVEPDDDWMRIVLCCCSPGEMKLILNKRLHLQFSYSELDAIC